MSNGAEDQHLKLCMQVKNSNDNFQIKNIKNSSNVKDLVNVQNINLGSQDIQNVVLDEQDTLASIEAEARTIYNHEEKEIDMGKLRATDFKYNKRSQLPGPSKPCTEALHQVRRDEMIKVFKSVVQSSKNILDKPQLMKEKNYQIETPRSKLLKNEVTYDVTNLTKQEKRGLKSLIERITNGEICVATSDKSKRFVLLKVEQYCASGLKHTEQDRAVDTE